MTIGKLAKDTSPRDLVKLNDKFFEPFIAYSDIQKRITEIANEINHRYKGKTPILIGVLNGSILFFSDLLKEINISCEVEFIRLSSYEGTSTTGDVKQVMGLKKDITNRDVIVIEDIVDTGITLENLTQTLSQYSPKSLAIATLLFKPKAYQKDIAIDFIGFEVGNEFLVGYGLDYDEIGRNLKDIYVIKEYSMINLILFGPPGAGKGTQSDLIKDKFDLVHLSTGDMFRFHLKNDTELGQLARGYMDKGELVPDQVVIDMIDAKLEEEKDAKGFIFDGFPRTTEQAVALDKLLADKNWGITHMLSLEVDEDELVKRLLLRGKDSGRKDDQDESIIRNRMSVYNEQTAPLIDFYKKQGKHQAIEGVGSIDDISGKIADALRK